MSKQAFMEGYQAKVGEDELYYAPADPKARQLSDKAQARGAKERAGAAVAEQAKKDKPIVLGPQHAAPSVVLPGKPRADLAR